jgi:hypothetical protein
MATSSLAVTGVKPGGGIFSVFRSWFSMTRSYLNPMATPQPMTENDIQRHLYPIKAANIDCRVVDGQRKI